MAKATKSSKGASKSAAPAKRGAPAPAGRPSKSAPVKPAPKKAAPKNKFTPEQDSTMLEEFTLDSLKDIYYAEKAILKALPKLIKAATSQELKDTFQEHIEVTNGQISRLEEVFGIMGKKPQGKKCEAIEGIIAEAYSIIEDTEKGTMTRDCALIVAGQKVEHYEIATYGGLAQIARTLGKNDVAELFAQTLEEEKQADVNLTTVAENSINMQAAEEGESEES